MKNRFLLSLISTLVITGCFSPSKSYRDQSPTLSLVFDPSPGAQTGEWTLSPASDRIKRPGTKISLQIRIPDTGSRLYFSSLDSGQLRFASMPHSPSEMLRLESDAGTFILTQTDANNSWTGRFELQVNAAFDSLVSRLSGQSTSNHRILSAIINRFKLSTLHAYEQTGYKFSQSLLWNWLRQGIPAEYAASIRKANGTLSAKDIFQLHRFSIPLEEVQKLRDFDGNDLIQFRRFGVPASYVQSFRQFNPTFTASDIVALKRFNVPEDWAKSLADLNKIRQSEDLVNMRRFGLTPDYIHTAHATSFVEDAEDIIELRRQGISTDFLSAMTTVDPATKTEQVIQLYRSGVRAAYFSGMSEYASFSIDELIQLRRRGITVGFVRSIHIPGRPSLTVSAIIDLKNRGVSAETIRALRQ